MDNHYFGGPWTEVKLDVLKQYLNMYTNALSNQKFNLLYIDACAGTGQRSEKREALPLLGTEMKSIDLDGSARIAIKTSPKFDKYLFIEKNKKRFQVLEKIKNENPDIDITVENGDANMILQKLMGSSRWSTRKIRGVIFLDPYGLEIDWKTMLAIASTQSLDVWFLFSISGVVRQASKDHTKMEDYKKDRLNRLFGTGDWQEAFYKKRTIPGLFEVIESHRREADVQQIESWVKMRLETCFSYVEAPLRLPFSGPQLYSLFFCVSNSSGKAIALAKKLARHIIDGGCLRQKSDIRSRRGQRAGVR